MDVSSDIDRLLELGLNCYGAGDLDGALLMWEQVLAVDPGNQQAASYVDYVRDNYELLTKGSLSVDESIDAPFAIHEEPEYQIEDAPGASPARPSEVSLPPVAAPVSLDPLDAGWDVGEYEDNVAVEAAVARTRSRDVPSALAAYRNAFVDSEQTHDAGSAFSDREKTHDAGGPAAEPEPPSLSLELEADEPPPPAQPEPINFEDATREYHGGVQKISEPIIPLPGQPFPSDFSTTDPTHGEFGNDETRLRKRDLGFVQPTGDLPRFTPEPSSGSSGSIELGQYEATQERAPRYAADVAPPSDSGGDEADEDLLGSLPTPRPREREPESGEIQLPKRNSTRDLPQQMRQPARIDSAAYSQAEVLLPHAATRELTPGELARTRDSAEDLRATNPLTPVMSAPTRELGLRPGGRPLSNPTDDDVPTGQSDARAIRAAAARGDGGIVREGTSHDIVLPFDPIAARAAQILDEVDAQIPPNETKDEQTRRRIELLLERASSYTTQGDLERAVAATDLALSEDPNSVLGQRLITRNKDTIMALFQAYLGDLDRMPQLAKPLHELASAPISPRAAFLLSRIDGTLTIDELLDVSGMPRLEAYRHLCQLYLRGILR